MYICINKNNGTVNKKQPSMNAYTGFKLAQNFREK